MAWKNDQVSEKETARILEIARQAVGLSGDFVELGCYKGDTSLMLAEVLRGCQGLGCGKPVENSEENGGTGREKEEAETGKRLWIYDSFEGLPEKSSEDESAIGEDFRGGELYVSKREVKERFLRAGLPVPVIKKGWFKDLTEADFPGEIAFSFIDGDFYESIRDGLRLVQDKMTSGGVIIVHDYNNPALPGVAKAVEEWLQGRDTDGHEANEHEADKETGTSRRQNLKTEIYQGMMIIWCV